MKKINIFTKKYSHPLDIINIYVLSSPHYVLLDKSMAKLFFKVFDYPAWVHIRILFAVLHWACVSERTVYHRLKHRASSFPHSLINLFRHLMRHTAFPSLIDPSMTGLRV